MTLLLPAADVAERRRVALGPLWPLVGSLVADLERVRRERPVASARKARMTRVGGRCARDGALLGFDPFDPARHRCPLCGVEYAGEAHEQWWTMWHHLWLAERAVHGAVIDLLAAAMPYGRLAAGILEQYVDVYLKYPNSDNVLGPSRPFFSTYLESIWLLQLCVALDALEAARPRMVGLTGRVRERLVEPSLALIEGYPEPGSNRQVWNAAARLAASLVLGDQERAARAFDGPHGVLSQLREGLLADGTWYEGENYHQFAHRGLWYGITLAETAGMPVPAPLLARFAEGFAAPFMVALPDFTLPARRDSQYAISLRQWRYAESCELGLARGDDPRLAAALARLYDDELPRADTGRWRSAAESERNEPASALSRADLGWRALLRARPERPAPAAWAPGTVHLPAQGLAVFRRDGGRLWVGFDYGHSGGSHGHPDRLNLVVADGTTRWLDDVGTGSYVERALHWYRSTLAHQAPLADGASQPRSDGVLLALADAPTLGGAAACARIAQQVVAVRALVVDDACVVDRLSWQQPPEAAAPSRVDLPFHLDGEPGPELRWTAAAEPGAGGLEDGFDFLEGAERALLSGGVVRLSLCEPGGRPSAAALWLLAPPGAELWRAHAPGPPGSAARRFHFVRMRGGDDGLTTVLDPRGVLREVAPLADRGLRLTRTDGSVMEHHPPAGAGPWTVVRDGGPPTVVMTVQPVPFERLAPVESRDAEPSRAPVRLAADAPWTAVLEEPHYRRSEQSWSEAGRPRARVRMAADDRSLRLSIAVEIGRPPTFVPAGAENPLDNERPEVNGDGVELFVVPAPFDGSDALAGWLLVPGAGDAVRVIATTPSAARLPLTATAARTADGYDVEIVLFRATLDRASSEREHDRTIALDVLVNEMPEGRERRRGQLVLSGARGGFVYLQGDRHDAARCLPFVLPPPSTR